MSLKSVSMFDMLKPIKRNLKRELKTYQLLLKDNRTPRLARYLLGFAVCYALMPFDIIPDFIPVMGHLDDIVIVTVLVILAIKMIPKEVVEDCRIEVNRA